MHPLIFLVPIAYFTSAISAVAGMAGGVLFLSALTFFYSYQQIIPIHGFVQLISNGSRTILLFKHVHKQILLYLIPGILVGTFLCVYLLKFINQPQAIYLCLALFISYVALKPAKLPSIKIPFWAFSILGIAVGFLGPIIGTTGPIQASFFLRDDLSKEEIVATQATSQGFGHLLKIPTFLYLGFNYLEYTLILFVLSCSAILGTKLGLKFLSTIPEKLFRNIIKVALLISAIRLIFKYFNPA